MVIEHGPPAHDAEASDAATDAALVRRLAAGNTADLATLYDRHSGVLFAVALRVVQDRQAAEDILQETFLRAWQRAATFDASRGQARSWLIGIAHHLALNELRRRRRHPQDTPTPAALDPLQATDLDPLEAAIAAQRRERLRRAIALLPPPHQAAVSLYAAGHSQSEIAATLNEPLGTIKSRLRRSLQELRQTLTAAGQVHNDG